MSTFIDVSSCKNKRRAHCARLASELNDTSSLLSLSDIVPFQPLTRKGSPDKRRNSPWYERARLSGASGRPLPRLNKRLRSRRVHYCVEFSINERDIAFRIERSQHHRVPFNAKRALLVSAWRLID